MTIVPAITRRRLTAALAIGLSAAALGACGGSDDGDDTPAAAGEGSAASSSSEERDSARVRLIRCLREQGLDIPDDIGDTAAPPPGVDSAALEDALEGPCAKFRGDAFADATDSAVEDAQEKMDRYAQCMRDAGYDFPDVELGNGPPVALHEIDQSDPDYQAADKKCADVRVTPGDLAGGHG